MYFLTHCSHLLKGYWIIICFSSLFFFFFLWLWVLTFTKQKKNRMKTLDVVPFKWNGYKPWKLIGKYPRFSTKLLFGSKTTCHFAYKPGNKFIQMECIECNEVVTNIKSIFTFTSCYIKYCKRNYVKVFKININELYRYVTFQIVNLCYEMNAFMLHLWFIGRFQQTLGRIMMKFLILILMIHEFGCINCNVDLLLCGFPAVCHQRKNSDRRIDLFILPFLLTIILLHLHV